MKSGFNMQFMLNDPTEYNGILVQWTNYLCKYFDILRVRTDILQPLYIFPNLCQWNLYNTCDVLTKSF